MSTACWGSRNIVRYRISRVNADTGAPTSGASNGWVSDGVISVEATPQVQSGDDFTLENGDGDVCQQYRTPDRIKGVDPVLRICQADPRMLGVALGGDVWTDGDGALGHGIPMLADEPVFVCFEWWTIAQDGAAQAVLSGSGQYWHHVIPKVHFVMGPVTSEKGLEVRTINGKGEENQNITGNGPFDDWPAQIATTDGATAAYNRWRTSSLPAAACSYASVTSAAS